MAELILCSVQDAENYLRHFRTKGSKNGIRRWQNEDGSLTPEGRIHYGVGEGRKKRSDLATETENDTSKRQRKMERLGRKIEKTDKRVERSTIKKVKKYDKSKIYAEKADQLFKEYMKYNSKALAMSEKSEAFYKKAERGKKKLEKYRRKLMDRTLVLPTRLPICWRISLVSNVWRFMHFSTTGMTNTLCFGGIQNGSN